jgi:hypothetical protein
MTTAPAAPYHAETERLFPGFDYHAPLPGTVLDMRDPKNQVGHQQRAFSVWWAHALCGPLDLGLDVGSPRGLTPHCMHIDLHGTGKPHPFYGGGAYVSDLIADAADLSALLPPSTFPLVMSNHSLEHIPAPGDAGIAGVLAGWLALLRPGGVLAMIVPDNDHFDVMASDRDHKHAWGAKDFGARVLEPLRTSCAPELVEYDTLRNHFSFNVVLRRRA